MRGMTGRPTLAAERRALQVAIAVAGVVPVGAGLSGALFGGTIVGATPDLSVDSHFRYLSGLLLGLGLAFWLMVPGIERHTGTVRLLTAFVVIGGLARLLALATTGTPSLPMLLALVMELAVTPALCLWQARLAERIRREPDIIPTRRAAGPRVR